MSDQGAVNDFVEDYRLTAVFGSLKNILDSKNSRKSMFNANGTVRIQNYGKFSGNGVEMEIYVVLHSGLIRNASFSITNQMSPEFPLIFRYFCRKVAKIS